MLWALAQTDRASLNFPFRLSVSKQTLSGLTLQILKLGKVIILRSSVLFLHINSVGVDNYEGDEGDEVGPEQYHSLLVSVRSLTRFLNAHLVSTTTIACEFLINDSTQ